MNRQARQSIDLSHNPELVQKRQLLCKAIEQDLPYFQRTIQVYLSRVIKQFGTKFSKTGDHYSVETVAQEILHETIETALTKAEEFDINRSPRAWLLGIAAYKVKGWQRDQTRESDRVRPISELPQVYRIKRQLSSENLSEEEILGLLYQSSELSNSEGQVMLDYLLSLVEKSDREILRLVFIEGLNGKSLAASLGIREGAVYTKKHRAIACFWSHKNST
ncbi:MAG: sigma-70 family RNA polymerase sigma factor [Symploca sp. SIO2B6]|nr:sigma-70 family RNA polymerase sigma factor [Symploca sp. SIO2B6]